MRSAHRLRAAGRGDYFSVVSCHVGGDFLLQYSLWEMTLL